MVEHSDVTRIIDIVVECLRTETHDLSTGKKFDMAATNARKSRLLFELNKMSRFLTSDDLSDEVRASLEQLKIELADNAAKIAAHRDATKEIADTLIASIREEQADGTYSQNAFGA